MQLDPRGREGPCEASSRSSEGPSATRVSIKLLHHLSRADDMRNRPIDIARCSFFISGEVMGALAGADPGRDVPDRHPGLTESALVSADSKGSKGAWRHTLPDTLPSCRLFAPHVSLMIASPARWHTGACPVDILTPWPLRRLGSRPGMAVETFLACRKSLRPLSRTPPPRTFIGPTGARYGPGRGRRRKPEALCVLSIRAMPPRHP
jgi:hypothetical protein